jgi:hypothetical protein
MKSEMRRVIQLCAAAALVIGLSSPGAHAQTTNFTVKATSGIWLAWQSAGTSVTGYFGSDYAPGNSPVPFNVTGGTILTFNNVTGSTSVDDNCYAGPDGGCYANQSGFSPDPASGDYNGPADALLGVFLNSTAPTINGSGVPTGFLPGLDYQAAGSEGQSSYSPTLNQIFFIGDGLTGTGTGNFQEFTVPAGATGLYLGVADSVGASTGNLGSISGSVNGATSVPEGPALPTLGLGTLALLGAMAIGNRGFIAN